MRVLLLRLGCGTLHCRPTVVRPDRACGTFNMNGLLLR